MSNYYCLRGLRFISASPGIPPQELLIREILQTQAIVISLDCLLEPNCKTPLLKTQHTLLAGQKKTALSVNCRHYCFVPLLHPSSTTEFQNYLPKPNFHTKPILRQ